MKNIQTIKPFTLSFAPPFLQRQSLSFVLSDSCDGLAKAANLQYENATERLSGY